jgi:dihydrofolate reductase
MSLDGYLAGPNQSEDEPLGVGAEALHEWMMNLKAWRESHGKEGGEANASTTVAEDMVRNVGASIMGRKMFGPVQGGPWDEADPWNGWWGDDPPFHVPVFVLTHHEREPLTLSDTTFHFVTGGADEALERARDAAGDKDVTLTGGAETIRQYLAAGHVDEFQVSVSPVLLGAGERLLDDLGDDPPKLELVRVLEAPGVTHLKYSVA